MEQVKKSPGTERLLFDAMDRLVAGEPNRTDGRFTQENIALEAGVSRATFNRYPKVLGEYHRVKFKHSREDPATPFTIEDKNRELQDSNTAMRRETAAKKSEYELRLAVARQEVFVLSQGLKLRDASIAKKDREIAELKREFAELQTKFDRTLTLVK